MLSFASQKETIEKSQNAWFHHGFLCSKMIMIGRLTKWNLICFTSMHTAKGTRQVPKWREMISEQLGENILLHVTPKCLNFTTKTWKSGRPQIWRRRFSWYTMTVAVSVKNSTPLKIVLYQTQKICLHWQVHYDFWCILSTWFLSLASIMCDITFVVLLEGFWVI